MEERLGPAGKAFQEQPEQRYGGDDRKRGGDGGLCTWEPRGHPGKKDIDGLWVQAFALCPGPPSGVPNRWLLGLPCPFALYED